MRRVSTEIGGWSDGLVIRRTAKSMRLYTAISTDVEKTWTTPRESPPRCDVRRRGTFHFNPKARWCWRTTTVKLRYSQGEDSVSDEENDDDDDESISSSSGSRSSETSKSSRSSSSKA